MFIQRTPSGWTLQANAIPLTSLITALSNQIGRPIVDKSNIKPGLYDVSLHWTLNSDNQVSTLEDPEPLSIFTAVQEQLGLRLVSGKGSVEVLVIDAVRKPSAN